MTATQRQCWGHCQQDESNWLTFAGIVVSALTVLMGSALAGNYFYADVPVIVKACNYVSSQRSRRVMCFRKYYFLCGDAEGRLGCGIWLEDFEFTQKDVEKMTEADLIQTGLGKRDARKVKELIDRTATSAAECTKPNATQLDDEKIDASEFVTGSTTASGARGDQWQRHNSLLQELCQCEGCEPEKIGQGASGAVFKVTLRVGDTIAVKTLSTTDKKKAAKAADEAAALQNIKHPSIVEFLKSRSQLNGQGLHEILLLMEFVPGGNLQMEIDRRCGLPGLATLFSPAEVTDVAQQLIRALAHCTQARLIHGDVKPQNVLIAECVDGQHIQAKLCDFSEVNLGTGTPLYMSPQRLALHRDGRRGPLDREKADVFSLGLTTVAMLVRTVAKLNEDRESLHALKDMLDTCDDNLVWVSRMLVQMLQWRAEPRPRFEQLLRSDEEELAQTSAQPSASHEQSRSRMHEKCKQELPEEMETCKQCHRDLPLTKDYWSREALSSFLHRRSYPDDHKQPSKKRCAECCATSAPKNDLCAGCGTILRYKGAGKNAASAQKQHGYGLRRCKSCVEHDVPVIPPAAPRSSTPRLEPCWFCGMQSPDHFGPDCPMYPGLSKCHYCQQDPPDHKGPDCPMYPGLSKCSSC